MDREITGRDKKIYGSGSGSGSGYGDGFGNGGGD